MYRISRFVVWAALFGGSAFAVHAEQITFDQVTFWNDLSSCVSMTATEISTESNVVWADTRFQLREPVDSCGCLSFLAVYTSSVSENGIRQALQKGLIDLRSGGEKKLVLASDPALVANTQVLVELTCPWSLRQKLSLD